MHSDRSHISSKIPLAISIDTKRQGIFQSGQTWILFFSNSSFVAHAFVFIVASSIHRDSLHPFSSGDFMYQNTSVATDSFAGKSWWGLQRICGYPPLI